MKYLKRIFESNKPDTIIDVESVFCEFLDDKYLGSDGEYYSDTYLEEDYSDDYVMVMVTSYPNTEATSDISKFDVIYKDKEESLNLMRSLRVCLVRLTHMGYKWEYSSSDDGYHIKVFYKEVDITLNKCFPSKSVENSMFKDLVKDKYDLDYLRYTTHKTHPNSYGRTYTYNILYFSNVITEDSQLIKDLKDLKSESDHRIFGRVTLDPTTHKSIKLEYAY